MSNDEVIINMTSETQGVVYKNPRSEESALMLCVLYFRDCVVPIMISSCFHLLHELKCHIVIVIFLNMVNDNAGRRLKH